MKASEYFRQMVGDRTLMYNPAARAFYEVLRNYEDHHATEHKDCEDASMEQLRLAMMGLMERPLELVSSSPNTGNTQLSKQKE